MIHKDKNLFNSGGQSFYAYIVGSIQLRLVPVSICFHFREILFIILQLGVISPFAFGDSAAKNNKMKDLLEKLDEVRMFIFTFARFLCLMD